MIFKNSKWIWNSDVDKLNSFVDFQIKFNANISNKYVIYLASCVNHMLTLNGVYIPSSQREGYECAPEYQTVDLSDKIIDGYNELIITVYSQGTDSFIWRDRTPGVIYELAENGDIIAFSSTDTPSRKSNQFIQGDMEKISSMLGFTFKANLSNPTLPFNSNTIEVEKNRDFTPRAIKDLTVSENIESEIIAQGEFIDKSPDTIPLGKRAYNAFLSSKIINEIAENTFVGLYDNTYLLNGKRSFLFNTNGECDGIFLTVDLQRNTVGYPAFNIEAFEDCKMIVSYGEHLNDMRPRSCPASYQFAYEVTLKKGKNTFVFPFRRTACRYFMALVYTKKIDLTYLGMRECLYPIDHPSEFECSDSLHTQIFKTAQRTLRLCMHDHYEDCPSREQAMYVMDTQIQAVCGYYALGEYQFPKSCFEMLKYSIRDDDFLEMIAPGASVHLIPCFSINYIPLVWEYYMFSGDKDILINMSPYMKRIIEERIPYIDANTGLISSPRGKKFWNFTEWQKGNDGVVGENDATCLEYELFNMSYNAFYSIVCDAYSKICVEIGQVSEAKKYENFHNMLNTSIHKYFWDSSHNSYKSAISFEKELPIYYTELANALAICCGACPEEHIDAALDELARGRLNTITTSHARYKYDALMKKPNKYGKLIMNEIADIWGNMLYHGTTSFWETERGAKDFSLSGSLCHGWSTIPIYVYFRYCLGIYPQKPGFVAYDHNPLITDGFSFNGEFSTPQGIIKI